MIFIVITIMIIIVPERVSSQWASLDLVRSLPPRRPSSRLPESHARLSPPPEIPPPPATA